MRVCFCEDTAIWLLDFPDFLWFSLCSRRGIHGCTTLWKRMAFIVELYSHPWKHGFVQD